jgi:hypothetical protein
MRVQVRLKDSEPQDYGWNFAIAGNRGDHTKSVPDI